MELRAQIRGARPDISLQDLDKAVLDAAVSLPAWVRDPGSLEEN
jgi:hypothetical protein